MDKQELINRIIALPYESYKYNPYIELKRVLDLLEQLDEPQPIKLKDVIARIKVFDGDTQKVWLNEILNELGSDYGSLKYNAGYEQGKFEGSLIPYKEPQKVQVPQFVADWIEKCKSEKKRLHESLTYTPFGVNGWVSNPENQETFARAWLDGYEVEKEKQYLVKMKGLDLRTKYLYYGMESKTWLFKPELIDGLFRKTHTRKELEKAGFGEVFNSSLFEVEEVAE